MSTDTLYVASSDVVDCDIGGDRALLNMQDNTYFTLNATASEIWIALSQPKSIGDLVDLITERFEVSVEECRPDVEHLVSEMVAAGIVGNATPIASS